MAKKGGYQMVNLATLTYALALAYLECGKPLLIYDGKNKPYFADSITLNEDDEIVIQKGGQTITIEGDDTITIDGDIAVSGGGGGGLPLYLHHLTNNNEQHEFFIVTTTSDAFIGNEDGEYLITNGKFYNILSAYVLDKSTNIYKSIVLVCGISLLIAYYVGDSTLLIGTNYIDNVTEL